MRLSTAVILLLLSAVSLCAQGERGGFNGIVTDATGAVVPNATVTALHVETGVETKATTTDAGVYRLPYLPLGNYKLTVSTQGFQTAVRENVILHAAQTLTVDFQLKVGAVTESVTVSAESPLLESSTAEVGRYVTKKEFDTWPIPIGDGHRQIQQFIFTSLPGTVGGTFEGSINGGQFYSHEILIEGISIGRFDLQGGSNNEFSPSAETVAEFKMQTGTVGAQYGGGQTAVANFALKSGTNALHGTAFTYVQNDALRAPGFTNNAIGAKKAPFKLFNWGYSVGGPVYIPKIYNGKNKTFFMTSLEDTHVSDGTPTTVLGTLPVVDFKQGNFSRLFDPAFTGNARSGTIVGNDADGRPVRFGQLYDPRTARAVGNTMVRDPFPNNVIPQAQWSAVSRNILQQAPITDPLFNRMLENIPTLGTCCPVFDERIIGTKGDHIINDRHRLSGYFNHHFRLRNNSPNGRWGFPPGTPTNVFQRQYTPGRMVRLAEDWTISPSVINHFAIGYNRFRNSNESVFVDQGWPEKIGLQNVAPTHFPTLTFTGQPHQGGGIGAIVGTNMGRLGSGNAGEGINGSWIVQDDLTIIRGTHNFKAGFEHRRYYYNNRGKSGSGTFDFQPVQTGLPGFADGTGHAFASFLLGAVQSTSRGITLASPGHRIRQNAFYFSDDWKATRKLTLNLGIRWEIIGPLFEVAARMSNFDPGKPNPGAGNRPGALVFVDDFGRKSFQDRFWGQFSPRFGFAYAYTKKLVLRGGYGINNAPPVIDGFSFPSTFGYNGSISLNPANTPLRFAEDPVMYLHNRYPDFQGVLPNKNPALQNGQGITYMAKDSNRLPYVMNYNLGIQYELPAQTVVEVSYIGNKGTRLRSRGYDSLNQLPVSRLALGDTLRATVASRPEFSPYPGFSGTVAQALRPYPQYTGVGQYWPNAGTSHYDSLQVLATRHFNRGLAVMAAYTFSKAIGLADSQIDNEAIQDVYNRSLERALNSYNVPHFFKLTWIYELPIGPGKLVNIPGVAGKILGGWTLTGIHNYRSGSLLGIRQGGITNVLSNGLTRPDAIPGAEKIIYEGGPVAFGTGTQYLNPAAWGRVPLTSNNVPLRLGTAPPVEPNIRGFHQYSEDFGIMKRFAFTEVHAIELRADMLNVLNRAGRGNPNTDITSPLFGKFTGPQRGPRNIQLEARFTF